MNWIKQILGLDKQNEKLDEIASLVVKLLEKESKTNSDFKLH